MREKYYSLTEKVRLISQTNPNEQGDGVYDEIFVEVMASDSVRDLEYIRKGNEC